MGGFGKGLWFRVLSSGVLAWSGCTLSRTFFFCGQDENRALLSYLQDLLLWGSFYLGPFYLAPYFLKLVHELYSPVQ